MQSRGLLAAILSLALSLPLSGSARALSPQCPGELDQELRCPTSIPPRAPFTETHPYSSCRAVDSTGFDPGRVVGGFGSGVIDLDFASGDLSPADGNTDLDHLLADGFVREVVALEDKIYVAASAAGVVRINRATGAIDLQLLPSNQYDVVAVGVAELPTGDVVVAGTSAGNRCGNVVVFDTSQPAGQEQRWISALTSPVYAIDVVLDLVETGYVTIFAGTACHGYKGLHLDAALQNLPGQQDPSAWDLEHPSSTVIREVEFSWPGGSDFRLYAACYDGGAMAFQVALSGSGQTLAMTLTSAAGWPLDASVYDPQNPMNSQMLYTWDVALAESDENRLAIAFGHNITMQHNGECDELLPCGLSLDCLIPPMKAGARTYSVSVLGSPVLLADHLGAPGLSPFDYPVFGIDIRSVDHDTYLLDQATGGNGLRTVKGRLEVGLWIAEEVSDWGPHEPDPLDPTYNIGVPLQSNNTLARFGPALHSGTEATLPTWDLGSPDRLERAVSIDYWEDGPGALGVVAPSVLSGFASAPGEPGRLYSIQEGNVIVYDIETDPLAPAHGPEVLDKGGDGLMGRVMEGLRLNAADPKTRWIGLAMNSIERTICGTPTQTTGGLRVINLGFGLDFTAPEIFEVATVCMPFKRCTDFDVRPVDHANAWCYLTTRTYSAGSGLSTVGIVRLKLTASPSGDGKAVANAQQYIPALTAGVLDAQTGRVSFDTAQARIYACFGCNGAAVYSDPTPAPGSPPTLIAYLQPLKWWTDQTDTNRNANVFQMERAWVDPQGQQVLYMSLLDGGFALCTLVPGGGSLPYEGSFQFLRTNALAIGFWVNPDDRREVYLADAQGGVHRMYFDPTEFP